MFQKILACTDLTAMSLDALRASLELAHTNAAALIVLHVVPLPVALRHWWAPMFSDDARVYRELVEHQMAGARRRLDRQLAALGVSASQPTVAVMVKAGAAAAVIAATARDLGADLIVVARGRGGKLGSTSEHVVRLVGRTVLVAPVKSARALSTAVAERAARVASSTPPSADAEAAATH
jgi:nucleotide-binding universal stress UspA family protein